MNFSFTKWKTIVSLALGILLGFYDGYSMIWFGGIPKNWLWIKIGAGIITFVIVFAIIYVIWSLIEKKSLQ